MTIRRWPSLFAVCLSFALLSGACVHAPPRPLGQPRPSPSTVGARSPGRPGAPKARPAERLSRAWNGQDRPPRLEYARRFSPPQYERFASRALYYDGLAAQVARATVPTRLHAIENDMFFDDDFYRDGELVLLDVDADVVTAFASRCYVDITYPTSKIHQDGLGGTEWGPSSLKLLKDPQQRTRELGLRRVKERPSEVPRGSVQYRIFEDNDIVLLYLNPQDLAPIAAGGLDSMCLRNPDAEVERIIKESTSVFGQEYVLVSKTCFKHLKDAVPGQDLATDLLLSISGRFFGMALGKFVFRPLFKAGADKLGTVVGKQAAKVFAHAVRDMVDGLERREMRAEQGTLAVRTLHGYRPASRGAGVRPVALPESRRYAASKTSGPSNTLHLAPRSVATLGMLGAIAPRDPASEHVQLLGVELPGLGTEERVALEDYLRQMMRGRAAEFIRFSAARQSPAAVPRGLVLLPDEQVVLNLELVRQGLARFDASDASVAATFPELVRAASEALDRGTGFAARWRGDAAYRQALKSRQDIDVWGGLGDRRPYTRAR